MGTEYTSAGGARHTYGPIADPSTAPDPSGSKESTYGNIHEIEWNFTHDNLPGVGNVGKDAVVKRIPAGSLVVAAYILVSEDFDSTSGTTTVDIGTQDSAAAAIDADGIATDVVTADGSNVGVFVGDGALIGAVSHATKDSFLSVTPSASDLTAGQAKVIVQFIPSAV